MKEILLPLFFLLFTSCSTIQSPDLTNPTTRTSAVDAHMAEFASPSLMRSKTGPAIRSALLRLPADALAKVTDRRRPVMFV